MSGFWDKVLGAPQPEQPTPPPAAESLPWWQRPAVDVPPPSAPQAPPTVQQPPSQPDTAPDASLARTQWSKQATGNCPNCQSGNYHSHPETPNARPRCYDCGYPITQSGTGVTLKGENVGPVQEARQTQASRTNDFNPRAIFDRLG